MMMMIMCVLPGKIFKKCWREREWPNLAVGIWTCMFPSKFLKLKQGICRCNALLSVVFLAA